MRNGLLVISFIEISNEKHDLPAPKPLRESKPAPKPSQFGGDLLLAVIPTYGKVIREVTLRVAHVLLGRPIKHAPIIHEARELIYPNGS